MNNFYMNYNVIDITVKCFPLNLDQLFSYLKK